MKLYPAIDVKNGQCVKLRQGQFHDTEVYSYTPSKVANSFEVQGACGIHIVDLNGVLTGHLVNEGVIRDIISSVTIPVQLGGGIRTIKDIEYALLLGAKRVIIGTKAVENPAFIKEAVTTFGTERIVVAIDVKNGMVAVDGWERITTYTPLSLAIKMKKYGVKIIVYKDIHVEKNQQEHDLDTIRYLVNLGLNVIVSGGISTLKDIEILSNLNVYGVIIGKALYENKIELKNAIDLFENC